ncbi:MAG: hypothetical protein EXS50_01365 [Candidatus Taylorbacteria bacterium]|nr:hypothetical protein [Candidatus Taylorbacteria bacterium]
MSKNKLVTAGQGLLVRNMANEKGISRVRFTRAIDNGEISRFLDGLLDKPVETQDPKNLSVPKHLHEFHIKKDGAKAETLLERTRQTFFVSDYAEMMTKNPKEFVVGPTEDVIIRVFDAESLGVTSWSETEFFGPNGFNHVKKFGLVPCLSDDAFGIRAVHYKQKLDEWIRVAHSPVSAHDCSIVFDIGRSDDRGCFVYGYVLNSHFGLRRGFLVALRVLASPLPLKP